MQAVNWAIKVMDGPSGACRWGGWPRLDWSLLQSSGAVSAVDRAEPLCCGLSKANEGQASQADTPAAPEMTGQSG